MIPDIVHSFRQVFKWVGIVFVAGAFLLAAARLIVGLYVNGGPFIGTIILTIFALVVWGLVDIYE